MSILPIVTYGDPVLREKAREVSGNSDDLQELIDDMFETMYNAKGVGLAAPQVGEDIRLFVVDADAMLEEEGNEKFGPRVFINPKILSAGDVDVEMEEGCLSIPDIRESITRPRKIKVQYLDREFKEQSLETDGWLARVIQHETDHVNGVLFIDYLGSFRLRLLKGKLKDIEEGQIETTYPLAPKIIAN